MTVNTATLGATPWADVALEDENPPSFETVDDVINQLTPAELIKSTRQDEQYRSIIDDLLSCMPQDTSARSKALRSSRKALQSMGASGYIGRMSELRVVERGVWHRIWLGTRRPREGRNTRETNRIARQFYLLELYWMYWKNH